MLIQIGNWLLAIILRIYVMVVVTTSRCKVVVPWSASALLYAHTPVILFFWHSRIMLIPHFTSCYKPKAAAVVSGHRDGEYVSYFLQLYKLGLIRGSSRRGYMQALKQIIGALNEGISIAITPDGPTGPRYTINSTAQKIACRMGIPILIASYSSTRAKMLRTWDRFIVPLPFSTITFEISEPLYLSEEQASDDSWLCDKMRKQVRRLDKQSGLKVEY